MGKNGKEQNILNGKEFGAQPCICLLCKRLLKGQCHTLFLNMLHFYEQAKFHQDIQNLSICVVSNFSHFLRISSVVQYYVLYSYTIKGQHAVRSRQSQIVTEWFKERTNIHLIKWPVNSGTDLNPIENVWVWMKGQNKDLTARTWRS